MLVNYQEYEAASTADSDEEDGRRIGGERHQLLSTDIPWQSAGSVTSEQNIRGWFLFGWGLGPFWGAGLHLLMMLVTDQAKNTAMQRNGYHFEDADQIACELVSASCFAVPNDPGLFAGLHFVSFASTCLLISSVLQFIFALPMSVCSEFGYFRNKCLVGTAVVASLLLLIPFCFDTKDSLFWLGGVVLIAASFLYNTCHIIFNSYLPLLVQSHHKLVDARIQGHSAAELGDLAQNLAHETSVFGDVLVMFPMILSLLLVGTFLFLNVQDEHRAARLGIFLVGIWALVFCLLSCIFLPLQLGSLPTPSSTGGCVRAVFMRLKRMVIIGRRVPNTLRFLLAYSLVWAGSTTLMNAWTVFGISELKLSFGTVIWALNLFGACALLSNLCCFLLVQHSWITAQNVLYLALGTILLLPGMVYFGVLSQWEFFLFTGLCGAMGGPLYSFGRSFFAQIVPQGHESAFFAMHQLATSALGTASPLLLIIVQQFTTSYRAACFSVSLFLIGGCILLSRVDLDQARSDAEQLKSRLFASSCTQIVADDDETEQDASFPDLVLQIPVSSLSSTKNALGDSPVQTYSRELEVDGPRVIDTQHPEEDADIELAALEHEYASEDY